MKIGIKREDLENELYKSLYEINTTRDNKNAVINKLLAKGYLAGDIQQIIGGNIALEFFDEIDLGVIGDAFYKATDNEMVNPLHYFDEIQLRKLDSKYKIL